jgi:cysteine-rich repeat protein
MKRTLLVSVLLGAALGIRALAVRSTPPCHAGLGPCLETWEVIDGDPPEACCPSPCGNGRVDPGEECDDGNLDSSDHCTASCKVATCGDGITNADEACDSVGCAPRLAALHPQRLRRGRVVRRWRRAGARAVRRGRQLPGPVQRQLQHPRVEEATMKTIRSALIAALLAACAVDDGAPPAQPTPLSAEAEPVDSVPYVAPISLTSDFDRFMRRPKQSPIERVCPVEAEPQKIPVVLRGNFAALTDEKFYETWADIEKLVKVTIGAELDGKLAELRARVELEAQKKETSESVFYTLHFARRWTTTLDTANITLRINAAVSKKMGAATDPVAVAESLYGAYGTDYVTWLRHEIKGLTIIRFRHAESVQKQQLMANLSGSYLGRASASAEAKAAAEAQLKEVAIEASNDFTTPGIPPIKEADVKGDFYAAKTSRSSTRSTPASWPSSPRWPATIRRAARRCARSTSSWPRPGGTSGGGCATGRSTASRCHRSPTSSCPRPSRSRSPPR